RVLADLKNAGREIILVTSGAIGVGVSRLKLRERPKETEMKQAAAAIGQCELMHLYDKLFSEYGHTPAQILMTRIITDHDNTKRNLINTFDTLLKLGVIPIVNENDSVAIEEIDSEEIAFGGNDKLSAVVATLVGADLLILLSDIEGLYDKDPHLNQDAKLIPYVYDINDEIRAKAGGAGSALGNGGMVTKLEAAELATEAGIDMIIMDGADPCKMYDVFENRHVGTFFPAKRRKTDDA
ncbi:MAG TPA: glutamate 5-kinase, partial [Clostridia bacterium]|nr:glutamate 5-kinase [Clostridia bacterium]